MTRFLLWFHGVLTVFWCILWPTAAVLGWVQKVAFVSHLSIVALILASFAAYQAARAEVRQQKNES